MSSPPPSYLHMSDAPSGWSPLNADGDDVCCPHQYGVMQTYNADVESSSSDVGSPSHENFASRAHEASDRKANPPRPPNAFILFRNYYTKLNAKGGPKIRRNANSAPLEDSHSKKAAQRWHGFSEEEKAPWKLAAKKAHDDHAKMYPNYRYRPNKRTPASATRRHAHPPSPFCRTLRTKTAPRRAFSPARSLSPPSDITSPSFSQSASSPLPPSPGTSAPSPVIVTRRSSSLPVVQLPQTAGPSDTSSKRRARSVNVSGGSSSPSFVPVAPNEFMYYQSSYYAADSEADGMGYRRELEPQGASPLANVASSLAGWNGEPVLQCAPSPAQWSPGCQTSTAFDYVNDRDAATYRQESWDRQPETDHGWYHQSHAEVAAMHQYDMGLQQLPIPGTQYAAFPTYASESEGSFY